jgi:hypothetical protein
MDDEYEDYEHRCYNEDLECAQQGGQPWFSFEEWLKGYQAAKARVEPKWYDDPDQDIEF